LAAAHRPEKLDVQIQRVTAPIVRPEERTALLSILEPGGSPGVAQVRQLHDGESGGANACERIAP
jgi:hypothetical protein